MLFEATEYQYKTRLDDLLLLLLLLLETLLLFLLLVVMLLLVLVTLLLLPLLRSAKNFWKLFELLQFRKVTFHVFRLPPGLPNF